jgi:hypothetical protein
MDRLKKLCKRPAFWIVCIAIILFIVGIAAWGQDVEPVPVDTHILNTVTVPVPSIPIVNGEIVKTTDWFKWFPYAIFVLAIFLVFKFNDRFSDAKGISSMKKVIGFLFACTFLGVSIYVCVATRTIAEYFYISTMTVMICYFGKDIVEFLKAWKAKV